MNFFQGVKNMKKESISTDIGETPKYPIIGTYPHSYTKKYEIRYIF